MPINLWTAAGNPSSYNPLPIGWVNYLRPMKLGRPHVLTLRAKSSNGATLRVVDVGFHYFDKSYVLTNEFQTYTFEFTTTDEERLYIYDQGDKGTIVIEDIVLIEKGYEKATINGLDGFGTKKPGMTGKLTGIGDFKGKVAGSTVANPHTAWTILSPNINPPTSSVNKWDWNSSQVSYDAISSLNGVVKNLNQKTAGTMAQVLVAFDVVKLVEKEIGVIPASDTAGKVAWIASNADKLICDFSGWGSGPAGNKVNLKLFFYGNGNNDWGLTTASHTSGAVVTIYRSTSDPGGHIGPDGILYALMYAEPSDGTTSSVLNVDYITLRVEMKQSSIVDSKWTFNPTVTVIDDETIELNTTAAWQENNITVPCLPSTNYTFKVENSSGAGAIITPLLQNGTAMTNINGGAFINSSFTTPSTAYFLKIRPMSNGAGKYTLSRPILVLGTNPAPYEKKRGDRMVLPAPRKNLFDKSFGVNNLFVNSSTGGTATSGTGLSASDYIPVRPNTAYVGTGISTTPASSGAVGVAFYDASKSYISGISYAGGLSLSVVTTPSTARYLRFCYLKDVVDLVQLEEGTVPSPYEPYAVQGNAKAVKAQIKSIFKPADYGFNYNFTPLGEYSFKTAGTHYYTEGKKIPVLPNTEYSYSYRQEVGYGGVCWSNVLFYPDNSPGTAGLIGESGYTPAITNGTVERTFTTPANCNYIVMRVARANTNRAYEVSYYDFRLGVKGVMENKNSFTQSKNPIPDELEWTGNWASASTITKNADSVRATINTAKQTSSAFSHSNLPIPIVNGKTYTLSYTARANRNGVLPNYTYLMKGGAGGGNKAIVNTMPAITTEWTRYTQDVLCNYTVNDGYLMLGLVTSAGNVNGDWIEFKDIQLDEGPANPYTPYKLANKPGRKGVEFDGNARVLVDHSPISGFDIETEFIYYGPGNGTSYAMIWSLNGNANYLAIRTSDSSLFVSSKAVGGVQHADKRPLIIVPGERYKIRLVYDPIDFTVKTYSDGVLIHTYQESAAAQSDSKSIIASLQPQTNYSTFRGAILSMELKGQFKLDFTDPSSLRGTTVKSVTGPSGAITGSLIQLNKQAKR